MNKLFLLILSVVAPLMASAQDVLVTKDATTQTVYVMEVSSESVYYRESTASDAPIKRMPKSDLLMIKYQDGRKEMMDSGSQPTPAPTPAVQQPAVPVAPSSPSDKDEATIARDNAEFVEFYNRQEVSFKDTPKDKDGKILYCQLGIKEGAVMSNNDLRMTLRTGDCYSFNRAFPNTFGQSGLTINTGMEVIIQNLREQTIYIDLGNSFFIRNGEASPYYVPSATSSTTTTASGASVNLGAVAGAMGIGGAAGTLASGVNVGGGASHGTTNVVYSQRVIAIPPRSSKTLDYQLFFPGGSSYGPFTTLQHYKNDYDVVARQRFRLKWGEKETWTESTSPLTFGVFVAYAFEETCAQTKSVHANFFLKSVMGAAYNMGQPFVLRTEYLTDNWNSLLYFVAKNI